MPKLCFKDLRGGEGLKCWLTFGCFLVSVEVYQHYCGEPPPTEPSLRSLQLLLLPGYTGCL